MKPNREYLVVVTLILAAVGLAAAGVMLNRREDLPVAEISSRWSTSAHADATSVSFVRWDNDDPAVIPVYCARCHSTYGMLDYLGADGSEPRVVDREAKTGTTVFCVACHNPAADRLTSVVFPSGQEVDRLGPEAKCATCHQGRQSAGQVNQVLGGVADDVISPDLSFINVHYGIAAATKWGAEAQVGYQYEGKAYSGYFGHAQGLSTCAECHDAHSLRITAAECSPCHLNVVEFGDVRDIRTSALDYDGDGDVDEGIRDELLTLHDALYAAIQAYATEVIGTPIVYADRSPFFFIDTNGNGQPDEAEINGGNGYATWTPRLVRTTYNYHFVVQDRGAYAHNPTYALQLMYDSLEDLGQQVRVDLEYMVRPAVSD